MPVPLLLRSFLQAAFEEVHLEYRQNSRLILRDIVQAVQSQFEAFHNKVHFHHKKHGCSIDTYFRSLFDFRITKLNENNEHDGRLLRLCDCREHHSFRNDCRMLHKILRLQSDLCRLHGRVFQNLTHQTYCHDQSEPMQAYSSFLPLQQVYQA